MIVDIISLIVMFVAVRVGLFVLERVLKGVTSLPIVKQADKREDLFWAHWKDS